MENGNNFVNSQKSINYGQLNKLTEQIISSASRITRFDSKKERGRVAGGRTNVEATILCGRNQSASQGDERSKDEKIIQKQLLKEFASYKEKKEGKGGERVCPKVLHNTSKKRLRFLEAMSQRGQIPFGNPCLPCGQIPTTQKTRTSSRVFFCPACPSPPPDKQEWGKHIFLSSLPILLLFGVLLLNFRCTALPIYIHCIAVQCSAVQL
jgi:hypothetical protein